MENPEQENLTTVLTCAYCGQEYLAGTPASGHERLTAHIKVCAVHPMRQAEARIARLSQALRRFARCDTREDLLVMRANLGQMPECEEREIALECVEALLEEE